MSESDTYTNSTESYSLNDLETSPEARFVADTEAEVVAAANDSYLDKCQQNLRFYRWRRRHEASPFNAIFYDREPITEEEIALRVRRAAQFFDLPVPALVAQCETLAMITLQQGTEFGSVIRYDAQKLADLGINNVDAFDDIITHELAHQHLRHRKFHFCKYQDWAVELACDFIVGVRCATAYLSSGKYKYAVAMSKANLSHPPGKLRQKAVEEGFGFIAWLQKKGLPVNLRNAMAGFTRFICRISNELDDYMDDLLDPDLQAPPTDIMDHPDSNLIKQTLIKLKRQQEENKT